MKKKKLLFIFGTRPEAIKMAPLIKTFQKAKKYQVKICVTAQHRQMLDQILEVFNIQPDHDLDIMVPNQTLSELSANILKKIELVLSKEKPDYLFIQGDTTTTYIAALAAFYQRIKICHIEAGLRTNDKYAPFPEEINRRMTSVLADYHFAPTIQAKNNLIKEGFDKKNIFVVGNSVIDALLEVVSLVEKDSSKFYPRFKDINFNRKLLLVTGHRRENFGRGFKNICSALKIIANRYPEVEIVYPVHLNPNVIKPVYKMLGAIKNIHLINPLAYKEFVFLISKSYLIITDSGGVQEEAPSLGKPVLVMREVTERPEAVIAGTVKLVGANVAKIVDLTAELLKGGYLYKKMSKAHNPYGNGRTSKYILKIINKL